MAQDGITHLLVVSAGSDAANRLISDLRNTGMLLRAANAGDEQTLATLLVQDQWDVVVSYDNPLLPAVQLLGVLRRYDQDMPVILVTAADPDPDAQARFNAGIRDVLAPQEHQRLLLSVQREAAYYLLRRQLRRLELRHRELEKRQQLLLASSTTPVSYVLDGVHLYCNPGYAACFSYDSVEKITTTPLLNLISTGDRPRIRTLLAQPLAEVHTETVSILQPNGSEIPMQVSFTPVEYHGKACLQVSLRQPAGNSDYSAALALAQSQDLLTRLDNRVHFLTRVESAIGKAVQQGVFSSLLVVELNEFVDISTAIGRSNANLVLNDIAAFLHSAIRKPYAAARLDEHTFGILLYNGDPDEALALGAVIQGQLNSRISPAMLPALELSCSLGMALINGHALDAAEVLARAHASLRQGNLQMPPGNFQFRIGNSLQPDAGAMLDYLQAALHQQRFKLLYQPLVHIKGDSRQRYEVLTRMLDSDDNEVAPGAFLPLLRLNGMGESFDRMIISMALNAIGGQDSVQCLIVTLTSNSLQSGTFLPWLSTTLRERRLPADLLVLQLSEIDLHKSPAHAKTFCRGLRELNVGIAISHFGCALEPFALLDALRPAFVKFDETVVRDLIYSSQQKQNVQRLIHQLHTRKLQVVVPQVEDMDVLPILWQAGADFAQGYCLQRPSQEMNYEFVQVEEIILPAAQP